MCECVCVGVYMSVYKCVSVDMYRSVDCWQVGGGGWASVQSFCAYLYNKKIKSIYLFGKCSRCVVLSQYLRRLSSFSFIVWPKLNTHTQIPEDGMRTI